MAHKLPDEIIDLILSFAPNFHDNLLSCHKEILTNHRPIYYKKVVHVLQEDDPACAPRDNFKKNDEIRIFINEFVPKLNSINKEPIPEKKVIKSDVIKIISKLFDLVAIFFVLTSLMVKNIAANIGKINNGLKVNLLGLITIITPINPTKTAHHRLKPTFSFKKKNAKIVTKKGLVINRV